MRTGRIEVQGGVKHRYRPRAEAGVSLAGLLVVLVVLGSLALVAIRVTPAYLEYRAVKAAVAKAKAAGGTVREMQQAFDRNAGVNDVTSIGGRDLVFSRDSGETEIAFAYERRVPLVGNASLLLDFAGSTDGSSSGSGSSGKDSNGRTATADK